MAVPDVFILAAEPSGDQLGSDLARSLQSMRPDIKLAAIGGPAMAEAGLDSRMSTDGLAILGFVEGLKAYRHVLKKVRQAIEIILKDNPKAVVLIDSWGFMVRVAKGLKAQGYKGVIIKYVAPQVWATRPGRARILAAHVDHLLSTQPMDAPYFDAVGLPQTFVGNPVLDKDYSSGDRDGFLKQYGLSDKAMTIGFFLGSRMSEIDRVGPAVLQAHDVLAAQYPDLQSICVIAEPVRESIEALLENRPIVAIPQNQLIDAMSAMHGAVACSGTITTQLAAAGVPTVVLYKLSALTFAVASRLFKPRYISLVNMSYDTHYPEATTPLMPEFMQDDIMTDAPAQALINILSDSDIRQTTRQALIDETRRMGAGSTQASDRAADAILSLID